MEKHSKSFRSASKPTSLTHIRWFDGDAALLLVFASVCEAGLSGTRRSNDPGFGHQRVRQSGLPVIHVGNHRHVPDVGLLVHDGTDLIHSEVHLVVGLNSFTTSTGSFLFIICAYLFMSTTRSHSKYSYKKKDMLETESISLTRRSVGIA